MAAFLAVDRRTEQFGAAVTIADLAVNSFPDHQCAFANIYEVWEALERDWRRIIDAGASWDHPGYKAHVTFTMGDLEVDGIEPYDGSLEFGPEEWDEIGTRPADWAAKAKSSLVEYDAAFDWNQPRDPDGEFAAGRARIAAARMIDNQIPPRLIFGRAVFVRTLLIVVMRHPVHSAHWDRRIDVVRDDFGRLAVGLHFVRLRRRVFLVVLGVNVAHGAGLP
jgi:hypothetical protein